MSTPDDSILSLVLSQPLVLWSFLIGVLILATAVTLSIISRLRQKKTAVVAVQLPPQTEANEALAQLANELLSDLDEEPVDEPASVAEDEAEAAPVDPLAAIAAESDATEAEQPAPMEVEVNSKLADLFQNDIIIDPQVQALRDSLEEIPIADLIEQIRDISGQLKEHIPAMPKFEVES